jgi:MFS transporter, DHA2 family, multidrug resistance protein
MHHSNEPFGIPDIKNVIPEFIKPWIILCFFFIYQMSGGVYLAVAGEMRGSLSLMQEDIMMAGFSSLVGLAITFAIILRLKFRFTLRTNLLITSIGLIVCNLICLHTSSVFVLILTCFISGLFRMWGTFSCNTTIQLWVTPKRDMAVWFCYIQLFVQCFIEVSGIAAIYTAYLGTWEYMHWVVILILLLLVTFVLLLFKKHRSVPYLPLFGIDWMGIVLWSVTILSALFILIYGDFYDWFQSAYIRISAAIGAGTLLLNLWRASFIRHPFIALKAWTFRNVWLTLILYILLDLLISPSHIFEHLYAEQILGYDILNLNILSWAVVLGTIAGVGVMFYFFAIRKAKYKTMTIVGFAFIVAYLLVMYFIIDYNLNQNLLMIPLFLRGIGYVIIAITFITALTSVQFEYFFQSLTIQAFISACLGSLIGSAFLDRLMKFVLKKNFMNLSSGLDPMNPVFQNMSVSNIAQILNNQAILISMKEIYGWLCVAGIFCLLFFIFPKSTLRPIIRHPKFSMLRKFIKHQLKVDKLFAKSNL